MKKTATKDGQSRKRLPTKWIGRIIVAVAIIVSIVAAAIGLWQKLRPHISAQPEYLVNTRDIEITSPPGWIRSDIKSELLRDAGLPSQVSILDPQLNQLLTQSFTLHPWIAAVEKIEISYPAKITVSLAYREPVAMVEVQDGLLPVDASGVLLPPEDFTPEEALDYPRISGLPGSPLGPIGTRWGNPVVEAASKLAELLGPSWKSLGLHHIGPQNGSATTDPALIDLYVETREGTKFIWGKAPGLESASEPKAHQKLQRLRELAKRYPELKEVPADQRDLMQSGS